MAANEDSKVPRYVMNVADVSYFGGKLETYFRFTQLDWERREPQWRDFINDLYPSSGIMQVPSVYDRDTKKWYRDSTETILHFELPKLEKLKKLNETRQYCPELDSICVLPTNPVRLWFSLLFEDMFDEWIFRSILYYRWHYQVDNAVNTERFIWDFLKPNLKVNKHEIDHEFQKKKLGRDYGIVGNSNYQNIMQYVPNFIVREMIMFRQRKQYIESDGIRPGDTAANAYGAMQYIELLEILNDIFKKRNYLFSNDYPTIADFGLMASMFRHGETDPTPKKLMLYKAKYVYLWVARMWAINSDEIKDNILNNSNDSKEMDSSDLSDLEPLIALCKDYLNYLALNEECYIKDKNAKYDCDVSSKDIKATLKGLTCVEFRVYSRHKLQQRFKEYLTDKKDIECVEKLLRKYGCWDLLWRSSKDYENNIYKPNLPLCNTDVDLSKFDWKAKLSLDLRGTPKWEDGSLEKQSIVIVRVVGLVLVLIVLYVLKSLLFG